MALSYRIMVRCPVAGRVIDSGIRTSGRETVTGGLFQDGMMSCPYCGQIHSFADNCYLDADQRESAGELWRPNK